MLDRLVIAFSLLSTALARYLPIVTFHGFNDVCNDAITNKLRAALPLNTYIRCMSLGAGEEEDRQNSMFGIVKDQVEVVCKMIKRDKRLARGFNIVATSQGGLLARAYVQRCNDPPVKTLITLGSPHGGIAQFFASLKHWEAIRAQLFPKFGKAADHLVDSFLNDSNELVYTPFIQSNIVPAQYFRDPKMLSQYQKYKTFLCDINNEGDFKSAVYKKNLQKLDKFVMYRFTKDQVLIPAKSSWFIQDEYDTMEESPLFREDWLGLAELKRSQRLILKQIEGNHVEFPENFVQDELLQYLQ